MKKFGYFVKNKLILIALLLVSILIIIFNGKTYTIPPPFGWDYIVVNYYLDIAVNIAIGYIVSLIFYIIVVYNVEYERSDSITERTYIYFARLNTFLNEFVDTILRIYDIESINDWNVFIQKNMYSDLAFEKLFSKYMYDNHHVKINTNTTNYEVLHYFYNQILYYIDKLEPSYPYLNKNAIRILVDIQNKYVFDYFNKFKHDKFNFVLLENLE